MRILVCGSRHYTDAAKVRATLAEYLTDSPTIVHGNARGADRLADIAARDLGLSVERHPANWNAFGRAAGPIRNRKMLDTAPDLVLAFGHGRGTSDTVTEARRRDIPVRRED